MMVPACLGMGSWVGSPRRHSKFVPTGRESAIEREGTSVLGNCVTRLWTLRRTVRVLRLSLMRKEGAEDAGQSYPSVPSKVLLCLKVLYSYSFTVAQSDAIPDIHAMKRV